MADKARASFQEMYGGLPDRDKGDFLQWIFETHSQPSLDSLAMKIQTAEELLSGIAEDLRVATPLNGVLESEKIYFPTFGEHADCRPEHTVNVDAFLYDDWTLDQLCDEGKIQRNYCKDCGSRNVCPLTFISHSMSKRRLGFLFMSLLPDLSGKTVLDVGSRLGAVLYGAYAYSNAANIIGVEINQDLCDIQNRMIQKHNLGDRIQVACHDVRKLPDIINKADVVIIHSVTDFFLPQDDHHSFWTFIKEKVSRPGVILITTPSLEKSLSVLKPAIDITSWVKSVPMSEAVSCEANNDPDFAELHMYECI